MLTFMWAAQDKAFKSGTGLLVNGATAFTVTGGPILIISIVTVCVVANSAVATTVQWSSSPTVGSAATFSGATASLVSLTAGSIIVLNPTALTTPPDIITAAAGGVALGVNVANRIIVKEGTLTTTVVTAGTGTFYHCIRYWPLTPDSIING